MRNNRQKLDGPKEIAETFNSYFAFIFTTEIITHLSNLQRLTGQTLSSILYYIDKIETSPAVINLSDRPGLDSVLLSYSALTNPI